MSIEEDQPYQLHFTDISKTLDKVRSQVTDARTRFVSSFAILNGIIETDSKEMSPEQEIMAKKALARIDFILTVIDEGEA